jgi:hypothetical protein
VQELQDQLGHVQQQLDSTMQALQASQLTVQVCELSHRQRIGSTPTVEILSDQVPFEEFGV